MSRYFLQDRPEPTPDPETYDYVRTLREFPFPDMSDVIIAIIAWNIPVQSVIFFLVAASTAGQKYLWWLSTILFVVLEVTPVVLSYGHYLDTHNQRMSARNDRVNAENDRIRAARAAAEERQRIAAEDRERDIAIERARQQYEIDRRAEIARLEIELRAVRAKRSEARR